MIRLLNVIPWIKGEEIPAAPELECQVAAYQNGVHSDTEFFSSTVDCINWAVGNVNFFDKFLILSNEWEHKIIGEVINTNGKKVIEWKDVSVDIC